MPLSTRWRRHHIPDTVTDTSKSRNKSNSAETKREATHVSWFDKGTSLSANTDNFVFLITGSVVSVDKPERGHYSDEALWCQY